jgi:predicted Zn-dependent protease with MMP-like domain
MRGEDFDKLVQRAVEKLPEEFRERLENVEVIVENEPSRAKMKQLGLGRDETLFGLYEGVPLTERSVSDLGTHLPDRITIYKGPLEREFDTPDEIVGQIEETVRHEIGHFFGMSEEDLEEE